MDAALGKIRDIVSDLEANGPSTVQLKSENELLRKENERLKKENAELSADNNTPRNQDLDYNPAETKVVRMKENPADQAYARQVKLVEALKEENVQLKFRLDELKSQVCFALHLLATHPSSHIYSHLCCTVPRSYCDREPQYFCGRKTQIISGARTHARTARLLAEGQGEIAGDFFAGNQKIPGGHICPNRFSDRRDWRGTSIQGSILICREGVRLPCLSI